MIDTAAIIPVIEQALTEQAAYMQHEWEHFRRRSIQLKGINDVVTHVDRTVEARLTEICRSVTPECGFINEEYGTDAPDRPVVWIIDPLDGTTNYVSNLPFYSISIAMQYEEETRLGWVMDVAHNTLFFAEHGRGAFENGQPIRVNREDSLEDSLLATGFPYRGFEFEEGYIRLMYEMIHRSRGMRRFGSAALDLAYTASGRFDGFFEARLNPWDVAAGALIVEEAGGRVTDYRGLGHYLFGGSILATNGYIHDDMLRIIARYAH